MAREEARELGSKTVAGLLANSEVTEIYEQLGNLAVQFGLEGTNALFQVLPGEVSPASQFVKIAGALLSSLVIAANLLGGGALRFLALAVLASTLGSRKQFRDGTTRGSVRGSRVLPTLLIPTGFNRNSQQILIEIDEVREVRSVCCAGLSGRSMARNS